MRGYSFNKFTLCLFLCSVQIANAQWLELNRPPGGNIAALASVGNTIFAGTWDSGIFRSTDNGTSWEACNDGIGENDRSIRFFSVIGSKIFAGGDHDIYLSTDNGTNWNTFYHTDIVSTIPFAVKDSTKYFAGGPPGIIRCSTDNGISWWDADSGLPNRRYATAIVICGDTIIAGFNNSVIYMSTDNGSTWRQPATTGLPVDAYLFFFTATDSSIFANSTSGLYRSNDNGLHWEIAQTGISGSVRSLSLKGKTIFAGSDSGVFFSNNDGISWSAASKFPFNSVYRFDRVEAITVTDSIIFAGTGGGVFLSTDNGASWSNTGFGFSTQAVTSLATIGDILFLGTHNYGIFSSIDNGLHWTPIDSGLPRCRVSTIKAIGTTLIAGISDFNNTDGGIFISNDSGKYWFPPHSSIPDKPVWSFLESENTIFAGTNNGVFTSNDTGKTWSASGLFTNYRISNIRINDLLKVGNTIFAANIDYSNHRDSVVFRSIDKGMTWTPLQSGFTDCTVAEVLAAISNTIFAGTGCAPGTANNGVFRSTDNGDTWTITGLQNTYITDFAVSGGNLFAAAEGGVYISSDFGYSWMQVDSGLTDIVSSFLVRYNDLYAVTGTTSSSGIWRRPISEMTGVNFGSKQRTQEQSSEITISSKRTGSCIAIELLLFSFSKITADVIDLSGRIVVRLVDTDLCQGQYRYQWNAGNVAKGCYFVHMQSKSGIYVKRILVL